MPSLAKGKQLEEEDEYEFCTEAVPSLGYGQHQRASIDFPRPDSPPLGYIENYGEIMRRLRLVVVNGSQEEQKDVVSPPPPRPSQLETIQSKFPTKTRKRHRKYFGKKLGLEPKRLVLGTASSHGEDDDIGAEGLDARKGSFGAKPRVRETLKHKEMELLKTDIVDAKSKDLPTTPNSVVSTPREAYGTPDQFKHLVKEAHQHGIAVILDIVLNHLGPSDLAVWQFDGWSENDKGGIYFYNDHRSNTPWGDTRPDYGRGEVRQYIRDNALMWVEDYHVDGLRMDMTLYIRSVRADADAA